MVLKFWLSLFPLFLLATACAPTEESAQPAPDNYIVDIYDNVGEAGEAISDNGFAAIISYNGKNILFDGGASAQILRHNAVVFGVDLRDIDIAVLSHSHYDHLSGFYYLLKINPDVQLFLPNDWTLGAGLPQEDVETNKKYKRGYLFPDANVRFVKENAQIVPGMTLICTTSSQLGWFSRYPPYDVEPGFMGLPELSLVLQKGDKELVLVVGCSHSGVVEIVQEAKSYLEENINGVVGGFHLNPFSSNFVANIAKNMKEELGVTWVAPTHCTGKSAREVFKTLFKDDFKDFGLGYRISF